MAPRWAIQEFIESTNKYQPTLANGKKRPVSSRCDCCGRFFFTAEMHHVVIEADGKSEDALVCRGCRARAHSREIELAAERVGLSEDVCRNLAKVFKGTQHTAESSVWRGKFKTHTITLDYVLRLWIAQRGICALSGRLMLPEKVGEGGLRAPSLDRIDSQVGYRPGNMQWVCWGINLMKQDLQTDEFLRACFDVTNHVMSLRKAA